MVAHERAAFNQLQHAALDAVVGLCLQLSILHERLLCATLDCDFSHLGLHKGVQNTLALLVDQTHAEQVLAVVGGCRVA